MALLLAQLLLAGCGHKQPSLPHLAGGHIENSNPLVMNGGVHNARRGGRCQQGAASSGPLDVEKRNLFSVVRPTRTRRVSGEVS